MAQTTFSGPVASQNGFVPGSFTTAQRNALTNVQTGTLIFNTTAGVAQVYNGSTWVTAFPAPAPTVLSVSPNSGSDAGGTPVTITGTNFTGATGVTFGGAAATSVVVVNATTITCNTPAGTAGAVTVAVTTPSGTGSLSNAFTYTASVATYNQGTDYSSGGVQASTTELLLIQSNWSNTAAFNAIIAKTSGTTFDVFYTPLGTSLSGSLTSGFTESIDVPGVYIASVNLPGAFVGSPAFCSSLTI